MVFHWSLSESKSSQVSRTLLSIFAYLNRVVVLMVSTRPPASMSSSRINNLLPKIPITIGIIVTFMFRIFFQFPSKVKVRILLFNFFHILFSDQPAQKSPQFYKFSLFFFFLLQDLFVRPRLNDPFCMLKSHGVYVSHSPGFA